VGLKDLGGVFSRYFIVGFFVPSFFGFGALAIGLPDSWLPRAFVDLSTQGEVLTVSGAAVLTGLVLVGLNRPLVERLGGEVLEARQSQFGFAWTSHMDVAAHGFYLAVVLMFLSLMWYVAAVEATIR